MLDLGTGSSDEHILCVAVLLAARREIRNHAVSDARTSRSVNKIVIDGGIFPLLFGTKGDDTPLQTSSCKVTSSRGWLATSAVGDAGYRALQPK